MPEVDIGYPLIVIYIADIQMLGSGYLLMKVYIVLFIYIAPNHPPIVLSLPQIPLAFVFTCGGLEVAHFLKICMLLAAHHFFGAGFHDEDWNF